jgi:hypothetical protein
MNFVEIFFDKFEIKKLFSKDKNIFELPKK